MECRNIKNIIGSDSIEEFFNKSEIEQDAMVMKYIKQLDMDRSPISRSRTSQYRCNKRSDNLMCSNNGSIPSTFATSKKTRNNVQNRRLNNKIEKVSNSPLSITAYTFHPIGSR